MGRRIGCGALCLLFAPLVAAAEPGLQAMATLASNYLVRGVSRSDDRPAFSALVHAQWPAGWFLGAWASTSHAQAEDSMTVDLAATAGFGAALPGGWSWRASLTHYDSPWQRYADFYRYDELTLDLDFRGRLLLSASYSPNTSRYSAAYGAVSRRNAFAFEATLQQELAPRLDVYAGAGYHDLSDLFGEGYAYGSIGLAWTPARWRFDVAWVFTGEEAGRLSYPGDAGNRALASATYVFLR